MKAEDYIGKQVSVGPNTDLCPEGIFKCIGITKEGWLELEDPNDLSLPWEAKMEYVTVI